MPEEFIAIKKSIFLVDQPPKRGDEPLQCDCTLQAGNPKATCCGTDDCLNRMMLIECGPTCRGGKRCRNQRFQRRSYDKTEVFDAGKKGRGLRATQTILPGGFIGEYVGEVVNIKDFEIRQKKYLDSGQKHMFYMFLTPHLIIDATNKGNHTRYLNHSCEPNIQLVKWMVNGELRLGFFATEQIEAGEECAFDYQYERYGDEEQPCFCGSPMCRGHLFAKKDKSREKSGNAVERSRRKLETKLNSFKDRNGGIAVDCFKSLMTSLSQIDDVQEQTIILEFLNKTFPWTNDAFFIQFLRCHGLTFIRRYLDGIDSEPVQNLCLQVVNHLPIANRNVLETSKIEDSLEKLVASDKESLVDTSNKLLTTWRSLDKIATIAKDLTVSKSVEYNVPRDWLKIFRESRLRNLEKDIDVKLTFSRDNSHPSFRALLITGMQENQTRAKKAIEQIIQDESDDLERARAEEDRRNKLKAKIRRVSEISNHDSQMDIDDDNDEVWEMVTDEKGRSYYWNRQTNETAWEKPSDSKLNETKITPEILKNKPDKPAIKLSAGVDAFVAEQNQLKRSSSNGSTVDESPTHISGGLKKNISDCVKKALSRYRKKDCEVGRITNDADFKHLARKITQHCFIKETSQGAPTSAEVSEATQHKIKNFVKGYMKKTGAVYSRASTSSFTKK